MCVMFCNNGFSWWLYLERMDLLKACRCYPAPIHHTIPTKITELSIQPHPRKTNLVSLGNKWNFLVHGKMLCSRQIWNRSPTFLIKCNVASGLLFKQWWVTLYQREKSYDRLRRVATSYRKWTQVNVSERQCRQMYDIRAITRVIASERK